MNDDAILVRPMKWGRACVAAIVGVIAFCVGLLNLGSPFDGDAFSVALIGVGLLLIVGAGVAIWVSFRRRRWLEFIKDGFVYFGDGEEREVFEDEIVRMAEQTAKNYSSGVLKSVTRNVTLWSNDEESTPIRLITTTKIGETDSLAEFLARTENRLLERLRCDLAAGRTVEGDAWTLDSQGITFVERGGEENVGFEELDHVACVDGHVCIWTDDGDEAFIRIPVDSPNAYLLMRLLEQKLKEKKPSEIEPIGDLLGRVIFERKATRAAFVLWTLGGLLSAGLGIVLVTLESAKDRAVAITFGFLAFAAAIGCIYGLYHASTSFFRCHAWGVRRRTPFGDYRILYRDVESFRYSAVRNFYNGAYVGTSVSFTFVPQPSLQLNTISYGTSVTNADDELDLLRDHISQIISGRMLLQLANGGEVRWTNNLTIASSGIRYRPAGWIGRKEMQFVPFDRLQNFELQEGVLHLWEIGKPKSIMQESVGEENFFPGFLTLISLCQPPSSPSES